jgi:nucleotide-binding universal stress UspA family protein
MTAPLTALVILLALTLAATTARHPHHPRLPRLRTRQPTTTPTRPARRIVFPFVASALSKRALDAALRLARAENATLIPVFLARVPLHLPLNAALPRQSTTAITLQEAIEQRATTFNVPTDARIERGRTHRHALRQTIAHEHYDRMVIAAAAQDSPGFAPDDVAWLLANAPGEIVVLRPDQDEQLVPPAPKARRRARARKPRVRGAEREGPGRLLAKANR